MKSVEMSLGKKAPSGEPVQLLEFEGPPNDPELALQDQVRDHRRRTRWAFSQLRWELQESRTATSIGYQAAKGGWQEANVQSREGRSAQRRLIRPGKNADEAERLNLEMVVEGWHRYSQMHAALAENGAATVVTTIDRVFKQFAHRASLDEHSMTGGPIVGRLQTTLLELIRAGGNWSRHRHEWQAKRFRWDEDHQNWSVAILSRCDTYHLEENVFTQIVGKMPWSTWIEAEEQLVRTAFNLSAFAFASPYRLGAQDFGYWNSADND